MKIAFYTAAAVAVLGLGAGTASAQYPATVVPHRGHYHVVPSYPSPYVSGYGHPAYSPGVSFGLGYSSPGFSIGGTYGGGYYPAQPGYGYGYGGHNHYQHHHHGHHHHR